MLLRHNGGEFVVFDRLLTTLEGTITYPLNVRRFLYVVT